MTEAGRTARAGPPPVYSEAQGEATGVHSSYPNPSAPTMSMPEAAAPSSGSGPKGARRDESTMCGTFFWINAGLGWVVWIFSVSAAVDQNWIENSNGDTYGVRSDEAEEFCDVLPFVLNPVCMPYDFFSASQIMSTILCSVAIVLYTVAFFRPAKAPHGSAQALGLVGGILMTITAFFQMLAFLFADMVIKEWDRFWSFISLIRMGITQVHGTEVNDITEEYGIITEFITEELKYSHGPTYALGIVTFVLSAINAIAVFVSYRQAGASPVPLRVLVLTDASGHSNVNPPPSSTAQTLPVATS